MKYFFGTNLKLTNLIVNFDTGAAVSTVPRDEFEHLAFGEAQIITQYKTASGELLEDHGQVRLCGTRTTPTRL